MHAAPPLPGARGPVTEALFRYLRRGHSCATWHILAPSPQFAPADEDLHLALYCLYELSYRGFAGVDPADEWDLDLLALRAHLEACFLADVAEEIGQPAPTSHPGAVVESLELLIDRPGGPSLSAHLEQHGALVELREFLIHRSAYQLKEADPHTWGLPRLGGRAKSAMVEIQADEYGNGVPGQSHAELFATTMAGVGLDPTYGAYLDELPAPTLATTNLVSMFGLHNRFLPALVGHLAVFEMTSVVPMGRYAAALRRHGFGDEVARFYDVHVEADAEHEVVARHDLVEPFVGDDPETAGLLLWGARALMAVERRFARHLLRCWTVGRSSLRTHGKATPATPSSAVAA